MATYNKDEFIRVEFTTTCKYCKKTGFEWHKENGKYRLIDRDGKIHTCRPTPRATDGACVHHELYPSGRCVLCLQVVEQVAPRR